MKIEANKKLWVSSFFTEKFGNGDITSAKTVPSFKTLTKPMNDAEIKSEPGAQECTLEDVAAFLENPPKTTDDGNWNIFYVAGFAVYVDWSAGSGQWHVYARRLDDDYWSAVYRVFSRNWNSSELGYFESLTARVAKIEKILEDHKLN